MVSGKSTMKARCPNHLGSRRRKRRCRCAHRQVAAHLLRRCIPQFPTGRASLWTAAPESRIRGSLRKLCQTKIKQFDSARARMENIFRFPITMKIPLMCSSQTLGDLRRILVALRTEAARAQTVPAAFLLPAIH